MIEVDNMSLPTGLKYDQASIPRLAPMGRQLQFSRPTQSGPYGPKNRTVYIPLNAQGWIDTSTIRLFMKVNVKFADNAIGLNCPNKNLVWDGAGINSLISEISVINTDQSVIQTVQHYNRITAFLIGMQTGSTWLQVHGQQMGLPTNVINPSALVGEGGDHHYPTTTRPRAHRFLNLGGKGVPITNGNFYQTATATNATATEQLNVAPENFAPCSLYNCFPAGTAVDNVALPGIAIAQPDLLSIQSISSMHMDEFLTIQHGLANIYINQPGRNRMQDVVWWGSTQSRAGALLAGAAPVDVDKVLLDTTMFHGRPPMTNLRLGIGCMGLEFTSSTASVDPATTQFFTSNELADQSGDMDAVILALNGRWQTYATNYQLQDNAWKTWDHYVDRRETYPQETLRTTFEHNKSNPWSASRWSGFDNLFVLLNTIPGSLLGELTARKTVAAEGGWSQALTVDGDGQSVTAAAAGNRTIATFTKLNTITTRLGPGVKIDNGPLYGVGIATVGKPAARSDDPAFNRLNTSTYGIAEYCPQDVLTYQTSNIASGVFTMMLSDGVSTPAPIISYVGYDGVGKTKMTKISYDKAKTKGNQCLQGYVALGHKGSNQLFNGLREVNVRLSNNQYVNARDLAVPQVITRTYYTPIIGIGLFNQGKWLPARWTAGAGVQLKIVLESNPYACFKTIQNAPTRETERARGFEGMTYEITDMGLRYYVNLGDDQMNMDYASTVVKGEVRFQGKEVDCYVTQFQSNSPSVELLWQQVRKTNLCGMFVLFYSSQNVAENVTTIQCFTSGSHPYGIYEYQWRIGNTLVPVNPVNIMPFDFKCQNRGYPNPRTDLLREAEYRIGGLTPNDFGDHADNASEGLTEDLCEFNQQISEFWNMGNNRDPITHFGVSNSHIVEDKRFTKFNGQIPGSNWFLTQNSFEQETCFVDDDKIRGMFHIPVNVETNPAETNRYLSGLFTSVGNVDIYLRLKRTVNAGPAQTITAVLVTMSTSASALDGTGSYVFQS